MAKLTPAQDKALKAFGADGEFPKGTRAATIEGIRAAGLIVSLENDGTWDLNPDGRAYLGLAPIADNNTTVDKITEPDASIGTLPTDDVQMANWERELIAAYVDTLPAVWSQNYREHNAFIWANMSTAEIKADMRTAVPIGRAGIRAMNKR